MSEARELADASDARDPVVRLQRWIDDAAAAGSYEPTAMTLATCGADGRPHARIVLMRGLDRRGLRFYTSYGSCKGRDLTAHPHAAAVFWWGPLERQVRVEGDVSQLSDDESDAYFAARPRGHQLSAWASEQSEQLDDPQVLHERYEHFAARFEGDAVPRPHSWGGYLLQPARFEFWTGRANRLHERIEYRAGPTGWRVAYLQP